MTLTIRDMILATTGVAVVWLSEARYAAVSRIVDTAPFEMYPVVLPILCLLHVAAFLVPMAVFSAGRSAQPIQENGLAQACPWTFGLFLLTSLGFLSTLFRRWEFTGPMSDMANFVNLTNTAIVQSIASVIAIVAFRGWCSGKRFLLIALCISMIYWVLVLTQHFIS